VEEGEGNVIFTLFVRYSALSKPVLEKKQPGRKSDPTKTADKKEDGTTPLEDELDQQQPNTSDVDEEDEIDDDEDDQDEDDEDSEQIDTDEDDDDDDDEDDDDEEEPSDDEEFATGAEYTSEDPNEK
jgi:hypothetical protein